MGTTFAGPTSSIVGLGNRPVSLTSRFGPTIEGKFSYCLVPWLNESNSMSILNFGDAAVVNGDGVVSTPLMKNYPS